MTKILLYHGTSQARGEQIIKEQCIRHDAPLTYSPEEFIFDTHTSEGYVYLTNLLPIAIQYGNKAEIIDRSIHGKYLYIFEVWVDSECLQADIDQLQLENTTWDGYNHFVPAEDQAADHWKYSLDTVFSVRVPMALNIPAAVKRYAILPARTNLSDPEGHITVECIYYRPRFPLPSCLNEIHWHKA